MEFLESVISLIITLGILVTVHEYGHFWVARRCGVKVLRFSVGFGKPIFSWHDKLGTEYVVAAIPLGGYVRMLDEREGHVPSELKAQAFSSKPVSQRIAIAFAGPLANFIFAVLAYWLMFVLGFSAIQPKVGAVIDGSPAYEAQVPVGSIITQIDDEPVHGWRDLVMGLVNYIGDTDTVSLTAQVDGVSKQFDVELDKWVAGEKEPDLLRSFGLEPFKPRIEPVLDTIIEGGAADQSGMLSGDIVRVADGVEIDDWYQFVEIVQNSAGQQLIVEVERSQSPGLVALKVVPEGVESQGRLVGKIGVGVEPYKYPEELIVQVSYSPLDSVGAAASQTWSDIAMTFGAVKKMVVGLVSLDNLSGPITIARVANQSISTGLEEFLRFLALLSVSLGVLNLLPIPMLDGGHILFYLVEAVRRKPLSEKSQLMALKLGMSFVFMLMAVAFYNDIMRL
ncbi:zinc metallopeptidase RseP [Oleiphilus sp. HI0125]|nr:RIP metalloprotease RseP [Oleiphilus sp. HI0125]KZZ61719.1 zinc metallopeptidase RseP [Oleiphilus sp. HI0125]